jgi:parallel beta-helix repeat protein
MRLVLALGLIGLWAVPAQAANLCVKSGGNDATVKASIVYVAGNEAGSTCWATIGRAVWGDETRSTPSAAQAADAGDTVYVFGATYDTTAVLGSNASAYYEPINSGTVGNYLTVQCIGDCLLTAPNLDGPIVGNAPSGYMKWYANVSLGHSWIINECAAVTCASNTVNTRPDVHAIPCGGTACWIEGFVLDGGADTSVGDNWNGIRLNNCDGCTVRNNAISNFVDGTSPNASCITVYGTSDTTIEHNTCDDSNTGIYFKDTGISPAQNNNHIRYNLLTGVNRCFRMSIVTAPADEDTSYFYSNVCRNGSGGVRLIGSRNDWFFNNVFYNLSGIDGVPLYAAGSGGNVSGVRFWNNITRTTAYGVYIDAAMPTDATQDLEHNVYFTFSSVFYQGTDASRSFDGFVAASVNQDPLFVDAANGDFRLCTGVNTPEVGCSGASPAINRGVDLGDLDGDASTTDAINAGVYVTGNEVIGLDVTPSVGVPPPTRIRIRMEDAAAAILLPVFVWTKRRRTV